MRTRYIVFLFPPLKATTFNLHVVRVKMTRFNHTNDLIVISIFPLINLTTVLLLPSNFYYGPSLTNKDTF